MIKINNRTISNKCSPYIIAELSANHNGSIGRALEIISAAKKCGADAIKIQTYRPDTITIDCDKSDFRIQGGLWAGRTLYSLYQEAHMPWDWHKPLFEHAKKIGITIFSSPFDNTAVDLLEDLNTPAYKIASFEAIDIPLIQYAASTKKPLIISTGMADADEILEAITAAQDAGCKELAILHCVSGYPAPASDYNLKTIPDMLEKYGVVTGLSDHTIDNTTAIAAVALGASIIEKHFTLNRDAGGPDDSFSLEPLELANLCKDAKTAWSALGRVNYERKASEQGNLIFRRSLYFVKAMKKGEVITEEHIRSIRPGYGLPPKCYAQLIGQVVNRDIDYGTPTSMELLHS
jgi:N-acetylneuraminate synthase